MSMILKSYEEGKIPLEEWTDDMLTTLPGWTGWQHNDSAGGAYRWSQNYINGMTTVNWDCVIALPGDNVPCVAGCEFPTSEEASLPKIAHRPYYYCNGKYYIKGNPVDSAGNWAHWSIAQVSSIPEE